MLHLLETRRGPRDVGLSRPGNVEVLLQVYYNVIVLHSLGIYFSLILSFKELESKQQ